MKRTLLTAALAISLCAPTYALEQYNPNADEDTKIAYPVFGDEDQTQANMGNHTLEDEENQNTKVGKPAKVENQKEEAEAQKQATAVATNGDVDEDIELSTGRVKSDRVQKDLAETDRDYVPPMDYQISMSKEDEELVNAANAANQDPSKKKKDTTPDYSSYPVYINGDHVEFENATGDFLATGQVRLSQGPEVLLTNYAFGNMKTGDIYLLEGGTLLEPGNRTEGRWMHYNYNNKTGELKQIKGRGKTDFYKAPHAFVMPDKIVADQGGMTTRCTAQKHAPCMHVEAEKIEIYPKEKMVAHEVKVFMGGKHIYSRKLWMNEFRQKRGFWKPSIGYDGKDNGFYIRAEFNENLSEHDNLYINLMEFSKTGFRPRYELNHDERNWYVAYKNSWEEDSNYWYWKQNDFVVGYKPHYFAKQLPLTYSAYFERGLWHSQNKDSLASSDASWHTQYGFYINHDPIRLFSPNTTLHLTYGKKWIKESESEDTVSTDVYYATVRQKIDSNKRFWVSYLREDRKSTLFDLGQADMSRELRLGLQWQPGKNDILSIVDRYNLDDPENSSGYKRGVTTHQYETSLNWYHRFCCWAIQLTYQKQWYKDDNQLKFQYFFYNW